MMSDWIVKKLEKKTNNNLHLNCPEGSCFGVLTVKSLDQKNFFSNAKF